MLKIVIGPDGRPVIQNVEDDPTKSPFDPRYQKQFVASPNANVAQKDNTRVATKQAKPDKVQQSNDPKVRKAGDKEAAKKKYWADVVKARTDLMYPTVDVGEKDMTFDKKSEIRDFRQYPGGEVSHVAFDLPTKVKPSSVDYGLNQNITEKSPVPMYDLSYNFGEGMPETQIKDRSPYGFKLTGNNIWDRMRDVAIEAVLPDRYTDNRDRDKAEDRLKAHANRIDKAYKGRYDPEKVAEANTPEDKELGHTPNKDGTSGYGSGMIGYINPMDLKKEIHGPDYEQWARFLQFQPMFNMKTTKMPVQYSSVYDIGGLGSTKPAGIAQSTLKMAEGDNLVTGTERNRYGTINVGSAYMPEVMLPENRTRDKRAEMLSTLSHEMLHNFTPGRDYMVPRGYEGPRAYQGHGPFDAVLTDLYKRFEPLRADYETAFKENYSNPQDVPAEVVDKQWGYESSPVEQIAHIVGLADQSAASGGVGHPFRQIFRNLPSGMTMEEAIQSPMYDEAVNKLIEEIGNKANSGDLDPSTSNYYRRWFKMLSKHPDIMKNILRMFGANTGAPSGSSALDNAVVSRGETA